MVEYMSKHIGEQFEGVISSVTSWGFYVELPNTIEGMVSVTSLNGFFIFDENHYELVSETTKEKYKLGQKIKVEVAKTDKMLRIIDFTVVK